MHVPTLMIQEPFFSIPVAAAPTVQDTVVTTHVVISPVATMNKNQEPLIQEQIETVVAHLEELQQPYMEDVPNVEALKGVKELENQSSLKTMKSILVKKFK